MTDEAMFRPEDVLELVRRRPFVPFRIYMSDGSQYEVSHPEQVMVSVRTVQVGVPSERRPGVMQNIHLCAIMHISRLEPLADAG